MFLEVLSSGHSQYKRDLLKLPSCLDLLRFAEAVQWEMGLVVEEVPELVRPGILPFEDVVSQSPS